jgi:hypothetical protein
VSASIDLLGVDGNGTMLLITRLAERTHIDEWKVGRAARGGKWIDAMIIRRLTDPITRPKT